VESSWPELASLNLTDNPHSHNVMENRRPNHFCPGAPCFPQDPATGSRKPAWWEASPALTLAGHCQVVGPLRVTSVCSPHFLD